jgi:hypothetical protein
LSGDRLHIQSKGEFVVPHPNQVLEQLLFVDSPDRRIVLKVGSLERLRAERTAGHSDDQTEPASERVGPIRKPAIARHMTSSRLRSTERARNRGRPRKPVSGRVAVIRPTGHRSRRHASADDERQFRIEYVGVPKDYARVAMDRNGDYPRESIQVKVTIAFLSDRSEHREVRHPSFKLGSLGFSLRVTSDRQHGNIVELVRAGDV